MRCDNCHSDTGDGLAADFVAFSFSPEVTCKEGKTTVFKRKQLSYTPFSVWFCRDCIARNRKIISWITIGFYTVDLILITLFGYFSWKQSKVHIPLALLLLAAITVTFYLTFIAFKPLRAVTESDLSVLFFFEIREMRKKKVDMPFHMTLQRYQRRKNKHKPSGSS